MRYTSRNWIIPAVFTTLYAATVQAQSIISARVVYGCYRLTTPSGDSLQHFFSTPIQLDTVVSGEARFRPFSGAPAYPLRSTTGDPDSVYRAKTIAPGARPIGEPARSYWRIVLPDSLVLTWGGGFLHHEVRVRFAGHELSGQQIMRSDGIDPQNPFRWFPVIGRRVRCPE